MYSNKDINFTTIIFSLSITFEILLFFLITETIKLSRILQYFFILFIFFSLFFRRKLIFYKLPYNKFIGYYLLFVIVISLSFLFNNILNLENIIKPLKQIIIYLYYLFFFILLKIFIIDTESKFNFFVKLIRKIFIFFLYLGFIIYFVKYFFDIHLIDKHLYTFFDGFDFTFKHYLGFTFGNENQKQLNFGLRYYGFFGEPRDSAVIILFGITVLIFENFYLNKVRNLKVHLFFSIIALFATLSMTFILSILFILPLLFIIKLKNFFDIKLLFLIFTILLIGLIFLYFNLRLRLYLFEFLVFYNFDKELINFLNSYHFYSLESGKSLYIDEIRNSTSLPIHLSTQAISFQPIIEFINYFFNFEFNKFLFGNGISSTLDFHLNSINFLYSDFVPSYPPSQLTRILYEGGFICFLLWIYAFYNPLKNILSLNNNKQGSKLLFFVYLGLLSASLIHRSVTIFIMVGILINYNYIFIKNDLRNK